MVSPVDIDIDNVNLGVIRYLWHHPQNRNADFHFVWHNICIFLRCSVHDVSRFVYKLAYIIVIQQNIMFFLQHEMLSAA